MTLTFMEASNHNSQHKPTFSSSPKVKYCPLIQAVKKGDIGLVQKLLEEGEDVNVQVEGGWTPLHNAVKEGHKDIVQLLLEKGADAHIKKDNGATPFIVAGIVGNVELLKLFLSKGANINEYDNHGFTAFMEAACYGQVNALEFLYENGAQVNLGRQTSEEQKKLCKGGNTALMDAAEQGHVNALKILLEKMNADVNARDNMGRNALIHSFLNPKNKNVKEIVCLLLKHRADVNVKGEKGKTPLFLAVEKEDVELVHIILEHDGIDINDRDNDGNTALQVAVMKDQYDIARLLCEKGAKVDCGELIRTAQNNYNQQMVNLLRDHGASENVPFPHKVYEPNSQRWQDGLRNLYRIQRPMIGKLKIFIQEKYRIAETSEGGVYLGFYDGKEAAVKRFQGDSKRALQEKTCIRHCQNNSNLVTFYGSESQKGCLYLCFALCEKTLEEHLTDQGAEALKNEDFQNILRSLFKAVQELHRSNYTHQDLHPGNILIDSKDEVCLADFDKSEKLDKGWQKVKDDLKALGRLVLYVVQVGKDPFSKIQAQSDTEVIEACVNEETKDLVQNLLSPGEECQNQLSEMLSHPFFWSCKTRNRFLRDVGNESDIKKGNYRSKILKKLNRTKAFENWREKIDKDVMEKMDSFYSFKKCYRNTVGDLLKFIRNMGEHIEEETYKDVKPKIGEMSQYFQELFPGLVMYVYNRLRNMDYRKHFPNVNSS
ncbi:2-5A-dependent ribonuclease [Phascolarctos cinereus]|uniref:2-5A-dependent ribonuclease n=1 Tax=Phascolarctos cinereus TaxID=38626 RepID=A0A6P5K3Y7_PHACI|nr:2-5A-dependent ribonuclease [Phascolarctos cinereus]